MASLTEGLTIGDVVKQELDLKASRDVKLVDANQTLVIGTVCQAGAGGRMKTLGALANEVQTAAITGTLSSGTWRILVPLPDGGAEWTDGIAYNASTANINTAIATTVLGASQIVASGTAITAMVFTFSGALVAGWAAPLIELDVNDLVTAEDTIIGRTTAGGRQNAAVDEVQTATVTGTGASGTFTLTVPLPNGTTMTTAAIAYTANAATIETAIDTAFALQTPAPAAGSISAAGTDMETGDITLTFDGEEYEARDWPLVTIDFALVVTWTAGVFAETTKGSPESTGSASAVCLEAVTTAAVYITEAVFLVRDAVVDVDQLTFSATANRVDAIEELKAIGIVPRSEPTYTTLN